MATETAIDVVMPQMGVSVSEGTITRWLKQEGEHVEADEPLLEISTDKVDTEVPSPASGTVTQILVQEGETVEVGTKLAQIGGAAGAPAPETPAPEAPAAPEAPPEPATQQAAQEADAASPAETPQPAQPQAQPTATPAAAAASENGNRFVSPVVARIAAEHGVDPTQVAGTGRGGRVTKQDILGFIDSGAAAPSAPAPSAPPPSEPAPSAPAPAAPEPAPAPPAAPPAQEAPPPQAPPAQAPAPPKPAAPVQQPAAEPQPGEQLEPVSAMRRGIAEHMRRSLDTSAHVTSAIEVDMSRVVAAREQLKKEYQAAYGVNPTYLAFVARAVVQTMPNHPYVNGELRGDSIVTRNFVNIGIAVELAEGKGLIVPVLKNAETMNLLGLAKGIADIARKARDKKLLPDDVQGGTFTITNPGGYGTFHGTPVISQPQAAILGTYALVKRPWVVQDSLGKDVIAIRPLMNITLTYDHRLVDGAYAGRFLKELRERLEDWEGDGA
jgi:pyruvate dehydrogenase E2 component (dihydrolipoamide acetyltransferase)